MHRRRVMRVCRSDSGRTASGSVGSTRGRARLNPLQRARLFIGRVVVNAFVCVAAARIERDLKLPVFQLAAAARLFDGG